MDHHHHHHYTFRPEQMLPDAAAAFDPTYNDAHFFTPQLNPQPSTSAASNWQQQSLDQDQDPAMSRQQQHQRPTSSAEDLENGSKQANAMTATTTTLDIRTSMPAVAGISPLQTAFAYSQAFDPSAMLTTAELQYDLPQDQHFNAQQMAAMNQIFNGAYAMPIQQSPIDDLAAAAAQQEGLHHNSMDSQYMPQFPMAAMPGAFHFQDINELLSTTPSFDMTTGASFSNAIAHHSPQDTWLSRSLSNGSENSWAFIELPQGPTSLDGPSDYSHQVVSPMNLHVRTQSNSSQDSDPPLSAHTTSSGYVEIFNVSPEPETRDNCDHASHGHDHAHYGHGLPMSSPHDAHLYSPVAVFSGAHSSTAVSSPTSSGQGSSPSDDSIAGSPKSKRRVSPVSPTGVTAKTIVKKKVASIPKEKAEKKVGRRKGPLRPEQRQQAHEIRKLRACLRCKFLKKVCDKGDPCSGCKPSHARLWQVPCTRLAIQDIAYFLKDWSADYERHVTMQVSVANIKGFSPYNRELAITHGYGYVFRVRVREVYLVDDKDLDLDWVETHDSKPAHFAIQTARLVADNDGISRHVLSEYVEQHLHTFEKFVDDYFESTPFLMEMLKTIYRHYVRTQNLALKKGLKLIIAYTLTLHITMVHPEHATDYELGVISDERCRFYGQIASPVMINFQVKKAMADLWREYMKDVLEELSALYASVYSGDKLKNWPNIFMLAYLILAVWEMMQFDQNYRVPDEKAVQKFCSEMENVPVGVIVGLFSAISTKMPTILEWDTKKHAQVVQENPAVCDTMTEVRAHVEKHESYLRARPETAVYDRDDFDSLSNKFLSKLVIRAGAN